jgi:hypothetical protein
MTILRGFANQAGRAHLLQLLDSGVAGRMTDAFSGPMAIEPYPA